MKLSRRLQMIATLVDIGVKVIDVGCDHAYLDIYLTKNNNNKCIATDINKSALDNAIKNIKKHRLGKKIETKLTIGLSNIDVKSDDNIVICGLGTRTIIEILHSNVLSDTLIISSNNDVEKLRRAVISLGYYIDSEIFLFDKDIPYIIIKFKKGDKKYKSIDYIFGPILKNNIEYRNYINNKYKKIIKSIPMKKINIRLKYRLLLLRLKIHH